MNAEHQGSVTMILHANSFFVRRRWKESSALRGGYEGELHRLFQQLGSSNLFFNSHVAAVFDDQQRTRRRAPRCAKGRLARGWCARRPPKRVHSFCGYSAGTIARASTGTVTGSSRRWKRRQAIRMSLNRRTQAFGDLKWLANSRSICSGCQ